jgi:Icc protein
MNNRRSFLKNTALLTMGGVAAMPQLQAFALEKAAKKIKRSLRVAHLTDVHLLDKPMPKEAFKRVLQAVNTMQDKPDFIINSGDSVMDMNNKDKAHVLSLWRAWNEVTTHNSLPLKSCIGNHDVWYAPNNQAITFKDDPLYGKKMALQNLDLPSPYYSFTKNGWKFIALDSINHNEDGTGYSLGTEQFNWLKNELSNTKINTPVLIFSHVPIITITAMMYDVQHKPANKVGYPIADQHTDVKEIKDLFYQYKNVRVALSGHIHYLDTVDYLGVKYHCGGAVSGNWWGGILDEFPPAYSILDLYEDGSSAYETIFYNWQ